MGIVPVAPCPRKKRRRASARLAAPCRNTMHTWIELAIFLLIAVPIAVIDLREFRIPDFLTLGGAAVFAALKIFWDGVPVWLVAAEAAAGFGVFWLIHVVTKGKMGLGDAKLSAMIAVACGFFFWLIALTVASVVGLAAALILIASGRKTRSQRIPFGPFLGIGGAAALAVQAAFPAWAAAPWAAIAAPGTLAAAGLAAAPHGIAWLLASQIIWQAQIPGL